MSNSIRILITVLFLFAYSNSYSQEKKIDHAFPATVIESDNSRNCDTLVWVTYELPKCYEPRVQYLMSYSDYKEQIRQQSIQEILSIMDMHLLFLKPEDKLKLINELKKIVNNVNFSIN